MKIENGTGWIWFFIDQFDDVVTEFFWLEEKEGEMPYQMKKASLDSDYQDCRPTRARLCNIET